MQVLDQARKVTRNAGHQVAAYLDQLSHGKLTANGLTSIAVVMHIPIALLIGYGYLTLAGILTIIFGLFDILDGELARLQKRASPRGMLYDATTDRIKETALFAGIAFYLSRGPNAHLAYLAVVACGAVLSVSYAKAKGEAAIALKRKITDHHTLNRHFNEGLVPYEVRITIIIIGLLFHVIVAATAAVAGLGIISLFICLRNISKEL